MIHIRARRRIRSGSSYPLLGVLAVIVAVCMYGVFFFPARTDRRITIAVASNPVMVWSFDTVEKTLQIIVVPDDTVVDGAYGYGRYTLRALWQLGVLEQKGGKVFADSISNAFGLPISAYVGSVSDTLISVDNPAVFARNFFSWIRIFRFFGNQFSTNLTFRQTVDITRAATGTTSDSAYITDFVARPVTYPVEMPDNTTQLVLDTQRVDAILKGKFDDPVIRKEALSVALFNSTRVPVLATRAARILSSAGILVISVDNSDNPVETCQITGLDEAVRSETAGSIARMLDCTTKTTDSRAKADLVVTIGTAFAERFVAKQDVVR